MMALLPCSSKEKWRDEGVIGSCRRNKFICTLKVNIFGYTQNPKPTRFSIAFPFGETQPPFIPGNLPLVECESKINFLQGTCITVRKK